jgi:CHRD domain
VTGQPSFNVARPSSGNPGAASFCQSRSSSQLDAIFRDPSDYYVDVHTKRFASSRDFTGGALRGQGDPGASAGCTTVDATLLGQIFANPGAFYVNVHTGDFPNGAVRGQLQRNR